MYPSDYLGDATMVARAANQREAMNPLDPPPPVSGEAAQDLRAGGPGAAIRLRTHGRHRRGERLRHRQRSPPGGFRLDRFGDAKNQAEWLLANVLAPPGTGKTSELYDSYASELGAPSTTRSSTPYGQTPGTGTTSPCSPSTADGCTRWSRKCRRWGGGRARRSFGVSFRVFVPTG